MARSHERVFRVQGIPLDLTQSKLKSVLTARYTATDDQIVIKSLAVDYGGENQVATISFKSLPPELNRREPRDEWTQVVPAGSQRQSYWTVDDDFHGLTVLFSPPTDEHKLEYVSPSFAWSRSSLCADKG